MPFSNRRGRPKIKQSSIDLGTPELIHKRLLHATSEPLDACLGKHLITSEQHQCGIRFRWLHSLRYGAHNYRTVDPTKLGGRELRYECANWRAKQEAIYNQSAQILHKQQLLQPLIRLSIDNIWPDFLLHMERGMPLKTHSKQHLAQIRNGLDILTAHWHCC